MRPDKSRRGNAILEFALVSIFTMPLLMGTFVVGMSLSRSLQVTQINRDAGHMYVRYVDFTQTGNQNISVRLASGMGLTRTGGLAWQAIRAASTEGARPGANRQPR